MLKEARQRIPPVLMMLEDPRERNGGMGCSYCGGLGHTVVSIWYSYKRLNAFERLDVVLDIVMRLLLIFLFCSKFFQVSCPKIDKNARQVASGRKDALATGQGYGGDW